MSDKVKIALICNNKMAYPAMQHLVAAGMVCAIATADTDQEVVMLYSRLAEKIGIPYNRISKKEHNKQIAEWLKEYSPDAVFVMTFPWRLSEDILSFPPMGCFNFHYGLLPEMRGADPVFEAIRNRKAEAGITIHLMDKGLDTGPVVMQRSFPLSPDFTYGMLCQQMAMTGGEMCAAFLMQIAAGTPIQTQVQDEQKATYWPKLKVEDISIDWDTMDVLTIKAMVRACNPIAKGAPVSLNGWNIGICEVADVTLQGDASAILPGTIIANDPQNGLIVCCKGGEALKIEAIYTDQGILPGHKLAMWGIANGMRFSRMNEMI